MTLSLIASALGVLSALGGLVLWWVKHNEAPSLPEQLEGIDDKYEKLTEMLRNAEDRGDFATADAIRRQLRVEHGVLTEPLDDSKG